MAEGTTVRQTTLFEAEELVREKLKEGGSVTFSPKGASMLPMLRASGDSVTLEKPPARLKRGDIALYLSRDENGERYLLHRLIRVKDGRLIFQGDNRRYPDPPAEAGDVIGVVTAYKSRGRERACRGPRYWLYKNWMLLTSRRRLPAQKLQGFFYRIWKRLRG